MLHFMVTLFDVGFGSLFVMPTAKTNTRDDLPMSGHVIWNYFRSHCFTLRSNFVLRCHLKGLTSDSSKLPRTTYYNSKFITKSSA